MISQIDGNDRVRGGEDVDLGLPVSSAGSEPVEQHERGVTIGPAVDLVRQHAAVHHDARHRVMVQLDAVFDLHTRAQGGHRCATSVR